MADDAHSGPGEIPQGVDTLALLAAGFFPTHAPRPIHETTPPMTQSAVDRCCEATVRPDLPAEHAQPPIETTPARIRHRSRSAAGLAGIVSSFRHGLPKLGLRKTLKAFLSVNQKTGYDCQSCAWPSPQGTRHRFELCESGAKAIADDGMVRTIGRE